MATKQFDRYFGKYGIVDAFMGDMVLGGFSAARMMNIRLKKGALGDCGNRTSQTFMPGVLFDGGSALDASQSLRAIV